MPKELANNYEGVFLWTVLGVTFFGLLGWRGSYGWRAESMPAVLAMIWIPIPYVLSHAKSCGAASAARRRVTVLLGVGHVVLLAGRGHYCLGPAPPRRLYLSHRTYRSYKTYRSYGTLGLRPRRGRHRNDSFRLTRTMHP